MRSLVGFVALPSTLLCGLAGCATFADPDDSASEAVFDVSLNSGYTYYSVAADLRRCPSPTCGGWFVQRLNRSMTRCANGRLAETCYTPVLDLSAANLSEDQQTRLEGEMREAAVSGAVYAIAGGWFAPTNDTPRPELGRLVVTQAWAAESATVAAGTFVRVRDNGLRCFAAPCPSVTEETLNTPRSMDIAEIDWAPARLGDDQLAECLEAMATPGGVLIAGDRYPVIENGTEATGRTATAAFYPLTGVAP